MLFFLVRGSLFSLLVGTALTYAIYRLVILKPDGPSGYAGRNVRRLSFWLISLVVTRLLNLIF